MHSECVFTQHRCTWFPPSLAPSHTFPPLRCRFSPKAPPSLMAVVWCPGPMGVNSWWAQLLRYCRVIPDDVVALSACKYSPFLLSSLSYMYHDSYNYSSLSLPCSLSPSLPLSLSLPLYPSFPPSLLSPLHSSPRTQQVRPRLIRASSTTSKLQLSASEDVPHKLK